MRVQPAGVVYVTVAVEVMTVRERNRKTALELRLVPLTAPVLTTEDGVMAPSVRVMAGVVLVLVTEPLTPFAVATLTEVTEPLPVPAPRFVRAVAASVAPVPPLRIATVPVTFAAVPLVFWLSVGKSPATAMLGTPVVVVFLRMPVARPANDVPLILVTAAVSAPVEPLAVTSPVMLMVWSPVLVPLLVPA